MTKNLKKTDRKQKYKVNQKEIQAFFLILLVGNALTAIFSILNNFFINIPISTQWSLTTGGAIAVFVANFGLFAVLKRLSLMRHVIGGILILLGSYRLFNSYINFNANNNAYEIGNFVINGEFLYAFITLVVGVCFFTPYKNRYIKHIYISCGLLLMTIGLFSIISLVMMDSFQMQLLGITWAGSVFSLLFGLCVALVVSQNKLTFLYLPKSAITIGVVGVFFSVFVWFAGNLALYNSKVDTANKIVKTISSDMKNTIRLKEDQMKRIATKWEDVRHSYYFKKINDIDEGFSDGNTPEISPQSIFFFNKETDLLWEFDSNEEALSWVTLQMSNYNVLKWLKSGDGQSIKLKIPDTDTNNKALMAIKVDSNNSVLLSVVDFKKFIKKQSYLISEDFMIRYSVNNTLLETIKPFNWSNNVELKNYASSKIQLQNGDSISIDIVGGPMMLNNTPSIITQVFALMSIFLTYQLMISRILVVVSKNQADKLKKSEQRFRSLFDQTPDPIYAIDINGKFKSFNPAIKKILKIEENELIGKHFENTIKEPEFSSENIRKFKESFEQALTGTPSEYKLKYSQENSSPKYFEGKMIPIIIDEEITGIFGIAKDVTKRVIAEKRLNLMNRSLEASSNGVLIIDPKKDNWPIIYINPAFTKITGYLEDDVIGKNPIFLKSENTEHNDIKEINNAIKNGESFSIVVEMTHKQGNVIWTQLLLAPVMDQEGETTHMVGIINDISELKKQESQLEFQANHDGLTGLPNRTLFNERLAHDVNLIGKNEGSLAVLFIDLDEFKPINDSLGHKIGDNMLISVAERLGENLRSSDTLARLGGDEFAMILSHLNSKDEAEKVALRLLDSLNMPHRIDGHELHVSASIGIAINNKAVRRPDELLQQADMAMYQAKQQGKNSFKTYAGDLDNKLAKRVIMRGELQEAINKKQLSLHYQPQIDGNGELNGLEALIRWNHPEKGFIPPNAFIPLAEETGQIISLSCWVLNQACSDIKILLEQGILKGRVAINLSPLQFHRANFTDILSRTLQEKGVSPENIELELTEGILMKDAKGAIETLHELDKMGINTSIDDFGTGYSSMSYLRDLPIHKIKIDKSFVQRANEDDKNSAICSSIITLAKELNMKVVSEGIETEEQHQHLLSLGSDVFQGFLFAKPMPINELQEWIEEKRK